MARHLGPDGFGQLNTVLAILAIAAPWASLSLDAVVVRELVRHPDQAGPILGTACLLRIAAGFTASGLPVGLQLVGGPRGEAALLSAAALYEEATGLSSAVPIDPRAPAG